MMPANRGAGLLAVSLNACRPTTLDAHARRSAPCIEMASESAVTLEGAAEPAPVESSVWDLWTCAESLPPKQRGSESAMLDARGLYEYTVRRTPAWAAPAAASYAARPRHRRSRRARL